jgi:hypothetical protein
MRTPLVLPLLLLALATGCTRPDPEGWAKAQDALERRDYPAYVAYLRAASEADDLRAHLALAPILRSGHVQDSRVDYVAHVIAPDRRHAERLRQRIAASYRDSLAAHPHHEATNLYFAGQHQQTADQTIAYFDAAIAGGSVRALGLKGQTDYLAGDSARGVRLLERAVEGGEIMPWAVWLVRAYQKQQTAADSAVAERYVALMERQGVADASALRL